MEFVTSPSFSYWPECLTKNAMREKSYPPGEFLEGVSRRGMSSIAVVRDELGLVEEFISVDNQNYIRNRLGLPSLNESDKELEVEMRHFFQEWFADEPEKLQAMSTWQQTEEKFNCMMNDLNEQFIQKRLPYMAFDNELNERHIWRLAHGHRRRLDRFNSKTESAAKDMPGFYTSPRYEVPIELNPDLGIPRGWNSLPLNSLDK